MPWIRIDAAVDAAFVILNPASATGFFAIVDRFPLSAMVRSTEVVKIGDLAQADFVAERHRTVAVKQVRMIIVHQFLDFVIPLLLPARVLGVPGTCVVRRGGKMIQVPII